VKTGQVVRKVVIPAAGMGTRFLPITKAQPKEMLPVVDKPVIQYVVEEAIQSGLEDILIITGRNKRAIEDHFDRCFELEAKFSGDEDNPFSEALNTLSEFPDIHFIRQREQKGLGDAILHAERYCDDEPFAVLLGDTICISPEGYGPCTLQMIEAFGKYQRSVIAVEQVPRKKIQDYGIIDGRKTSPGVYEIDNIVEKPDPREAPSDLGAIGRTSSRRKSSPSCMKFPLGLAGNYSSLTHYAGLTSRLGSLPVAGDMISVTSSGGWNPASNSRWNVRSFPERSGVS
jgi:UTP--glucose-1-phosphate uridylyltransferase